MTINEALSKYLEEISKEIESYDPEKKKGFPLILNDGTKKALPKFYSELKENLINVDLEKYTSIIPSFSSLGTFTKMIEKYVEEEGLIPEDEYEEKDWVFPELQLYVDQESKEGELFTAYRDTKQVAPVSGRVYVNSNNLPPKVFNVMAKPVAKRYEPRKPLGEYVEENNGKEVNAFNTYVPPTWIDSVEGIQISKEPPELFRQLVAHLFPLKIEQEFFYSWLHYSLYKRAYTFLVLCGKPGIGKNVLKKVIRALHGFENAVDGKKSTFSDRFNKQLQNCTLLWFDELRYNEENENAMKEVQNDTLSIEGKGVDATRSTRIHASMVIVNNKPRDNYLDFEARKFVPLQMNPNRLETSMKRSDISRLVNKVEDPTSKTFDKRFLAEIAEWLKKYGKSDKWPTLEYQGPMFFKLAHTSMTRWQKKAIQLIIEFMDKKPGKVDFDEERGFRWSTIIKVEDQRKAGKGLTFPSHSSVEAFFESFKDGYGRECFVTTPHNGKMNIDEDFWVKCTVEEIKIFNKQDLKTRTVKEPDVEESKKLGRGEERKREVSTNKKEKNVDSSRPQKKRKGLLHRGGNRGTRREKFKEESAEDLL